MISKYAPQQLSPEEVKKIIEEKFADVVATKNKGAIMKACLLYTSGRIMINELDGIELNCTCEMPTIVVNHVDLPGRVAEVTTMLSMLSINIATMSVYRDRRGGRAVMVVELDQEIDESVLNILQNLKGIVKVTYISTGGK